MKQSDLLPQKYKSPEKLSEFCLYDYLCDDEACPEVIQCLGSVYVEKNYYYIFSFTYKGEEVNGNKKEESSFLAITGPFGSKNVIQDFGSIRSWSKWEILEKDWKSQAESDIRKLIDQGEM